LLVVVVMIVFGTVAARFMNGSPFLPFVFGTNAFIVSLCIATNTAA
jgi:hypothetical protein